MPSRHVSKSRPRRNLHVRAVSAAASFFFLASGAQAADFMVELNQTRALHLASPAATVMVGNPAIADVSIEGPQLVYVLGRTFGKTNLIALDATGKQIAQFGVSVTAQSSSTVTLTRGAGQLSYNCTPRCERIPQLADDKAAFETALKQASDLAKFGAESSMGGAPAN